jgi:hypothetical protein
LRRFLVPRRIVAVDTYGSEPVGAAGASVLERYRNGQLNGGRLGGTPHFGMRGDPALTFNGLIQDPQAFQGAAQMGAARNASVQNYPALPNDQSPATQAPWLADWTDLEGALA